MFKVEKRVRSICIIFNVSSKAPGSICLKSHSKSLSSEWHNNIKGMLCNVNQKKKQTDD